MTIVAYKIFHCILREEFLELTVQLGRQGFIVRYYYSGLVKLGDNISHGKGLTGTCDTKQSLELIAFLESLNQCIDSLGLISCGFKGGVKFEDN